MLTFHRAARRGTGTRTQPSRRWSPPPVEPSLKRGVIYGLLLSLPFWGGLLLFLYKKM